MFRGYKRRLGVVWRDFLFALGVPITKFVALLFIIYIAAVAYRKRRDKERDNDTQH